MLWFLTRRGYLPPAQPPLIVTSPGEKTNLTQKQPSVWGVTSVEHQSQVPTVEHCVDCNSLLASGKWRGGFGEARRAYEPRRFTRPMMLNGRGATLARVCVASHISGQCAVP